MKVSPKLSEKLWYKYTLELDDSFAEAYKKNCLPLRKKIIFGLTVG